MMRTSVTCEGGGYHETISGADTEAAYETARRGRPSDETESVVCQIGFTLPHSEKNMKRSRSSALRATCTHKENGEK
jgi:hypothetical protein